MDEPPLTGKRPRLNKASIGGTPDLPKLALRKLALCRSPHFHFEGSLPSAFSISESASLKARAKISSRVSILSAVVLSSHQWLLGCLTIFLIISNQRFPPFGK